MLLCLGKFSSNISFAFVSAPYTLVCCGGPAALSKLPSFLRISCLACCQALAVLYLTGDLGGCACEATLVFLKRVPSTLSASKRAMPGMRDEQRTLGRRATMWRQGVFLLAPPPKESETPRRLDRWKTRAAAQQQRTASPTFLA